MFLYSRIKKPTDYIVGIPFDGFVINFCIFCRYWSEDYAEVFRHVKAEHSQEIETENKPLIF